MEKIEICVRKNFFTHISIYLYVSENNEEMCMAINRKFNEGYKKDENKEHQ